MSTSEHIVPIINSFIELTYELNSLAQCIIGVDANLPAWFLSPEKLNPSASSYRRQISDFLMQLEYLNHQEPREILVGPGIVAASSKTMEQIQKVNQKKEVFKQTMLELKKNKMSPADFTETLNLELKKRPDILNTVMKKARLARLHLKQCYRLIVSVEEKPNKVSWTWANTRSIKKISKEQAKTLLSKMKKDKGIELQLQKLHLLPDNENLAIVQELAPHLRANLVLHNNQRVMVKGASPIFYEAKDNFLPEFVVPKKKCGKDTKRVIRNDVKLEPEPYLPAIRAHRYQTEKESDYETN